MSVMGECGDSSNQERQRPVQGYKVYESKVLGGKQKQMVNYWKVLPLEEEFRKEVSKGEGKGSIVWENENSHGTTLSDSPPCHLLISRTSHH